MTCRTYEMRHIRRRTELPAFDQRFKGNEGFVRPVRKGQAVPFTPSDVPQEGVHYLVQDLDGDWLALISAKSPSEIFAEISESGGVPLWTH